MGKKVFPVVHPKEYGVELYGNLLLSALDTVAQFAFDDVKKFAAKLLAHIGRWPKKNIAFANSKALPKVLFRIVCGDKNAIRALRLDRGLIAEFLQEWLRNNEDSPIYTFVSKMLLEALKIRSIVISDMLPVITIFSKRYWYRNRALNLSDISNSLLVMAVRHLDMTDVSRNTVYSRITNVLGYSDMASPRVFRNGDAYSVPAQVWRDWVSGDTSAILNQASPIIQDISDTVPVEERLTHSETRMAQLALLLKWFPELKEPLEKYVNFTP